jgi:hypothetical protein
MNWQPASSYRVGQRVIATPDDPRFSRGPYGATVVRIDNDGEHLFIKWAFDYNPDLPSPYRVHEDDV